MHEVQFLCLRDIRHGCVYSFQSMIAEMLDDLNDDRLRACVGAARAALLRLRAETVSDE